MKGHTRDSGLRAPVAPAILVLAMAAMSAAVAQQKTTVVLGTATQGGGFQIYGAAYSAALNEADATLAVEQRSTKGSTENAPLLAEGKIDIGVATGEGTHEALAGIGRPPANLKIINAMYPNSGMFMVRGDSPYRTEHARVDRKSTRLNSSHLVISYAVFCLKKKKNIYDIKCECQ